MAGRIELREASSDDSPALLRVIQDAFEEYRGKLDPPSGAFRESEETLASLLQAEQAAVAVRAGEIAGCIFYDLTEEVACHVNFCAYLNVHPQEARQYADLKQALARQYPHDIAGYTEGKTPFILETEIKAKAWRTAMP